MFRMLIDTCVWLDLARDQKQVPVLGVVEEMVERGMLSLIVPRVMRDEFHRNRERVAKESARSLSAHFRLVKEAVGKVDGDKRKTRVVLSHLDDVGHKIPILGGAAEGTLDRIEKLLTASPIIEPSEAVKLHAAQRALDRKAPFHRGKNAMADAIRAAVEMPSEERRGRMARMRQSVREQNIYRWAGLLLAELRHIPEETPEKGPSASLAPSADRST